MSNKKYVFGKLDQHLDEALTRKSFAILRDLMEEPSVIDNKEVTVKDPSQTKAKVAGDNTKGEANNLEEDAEDENPQIAALKKEIDRKKESMDNSEKSNPSYHTQGGHDKDRSEMLGLQKQLADLKAKDKTTKTQARAVEESAPAHMKKPKRFTKYKKPKGPKMLRLYKKKGK